MKTTIRVLHKSLFLICIISFNFTIAQTIDFIQISPEVASPNNTSFFNEVYDSAMDFADCDGDGDLDVLISGNYLGVLITKLYSNDGAGNYTEVVGLPFEGIWQGDVAFFDADGDNDSDILICGYTASNRISKLYLNDGNANYTEKIGTPFFGISNCAIGIADIDGDLDQDILISGLSSSGNITKLYLNDGNANFTEVFGVPFDQVYNGSIEFADIDNDNDFDVLITGRNLAIEFISKLYVNDGIGNFSLVSGTPFTGVWRSAIAFGDLDNDSDQDVIISGFEPIFSENRTTLYVNDGLGNFSELVGTPFVGVSFSSIKLSDVDGDTDLDILVAGEDDLGNSLINLYSNDGGSFSTVGGLPFVGFSRGDIEFFDIDSDSDEDLLISGTDGTNIFVKLYRNIGYVGIVESQIEKISIYPNPTNGELIIVLDEGLIIKEICVKDVNGKLCEFNYTLDGKDITLNIIGKRGVYFVELKSNDFLFVERVLKQ